MSPLSKFRALLATLRIANAPSVVSNVLLGYFVAWFWIYGDWMSDDTGMIGWSSPSLLCLSALLLYFSGNLANDWYDRKWDRTHRPERALPTGAFRPRTYMIAALLSATSGVLLAFRERLACGVCALAIVLLIAIYTRFHKQTSWAILPMGLCRAGLYVLGFLSFWPDFDMLEAMGMDLIPSAVGYSALISTLAIGLTSYIAGLSLCARYESMIDPPPGPKLISRCLLILPLLAMPCWWAYLLNPLYAIAGMIPFGIWIAVSFARFRRPIPKFVSALLAGIPLVDLIAAMPLALSFAFDHRQGTVNIPVALLFVSIPLAAFISGRLLQQFTPAT